MLNLKDMKYPEVGGIYKLSNFIICRRALHPIAVTKIRSKCIRWLGHAGKGKTIKAHKILF
jgi:hypothetical protein